MPVSSTLPERDTFWAKVETVEMRGTNPMSKYLVIDFTVQTIRICLQDVLEICKKFVEMNRNLKRLHFEEVICLSVSQNLKVK